MAPSKTRGKPATRRHQAARPMPSPSIGKRPPESLQAKSAAPRANRQVDAPEDEPALTRAERREGNPPEDEREEGSER